MKNSTVLRMNRTQVYALMRAIEVAIMRLEGVSESLQGTDALDYRQLLDVRDKLADLSMTRGWM